MGDYERTNISEGAGDIQTAMDETFMRYMSNITDGMGALEQGRLQAGIDISPRYYQALQDLMRTQGVNLVDAGAGMADATVQDMTRRMQGPGSELARIAVQLQNQADPMFARQQFNLSNLMDQTLQQGSPEGEREEMARGLAALGLNPNSAINTAQAASHFGTAGRQRQMDFANLMANVAQTLPLLRSGIDTTALTLGVQNPGASMFQGIIQPDNTSAQLAQSMQGQMFNLEAMGQDLEAQKHQSVLDKVQQGVNTAATAVQAVGGVMTMGAGCHIARLCLPERWVEFFLWKEVLAPNWFREWYNLNSAKVANALADKPALIQIVRQKMLSILERK